MKGTLLEAFRVGFQRRWRSIPEWLLSVWGLVWLVVESGTFFSAKLKALVEGHSIYVIGATLVLGAGYVLWRVRVPTVVSFCIKTTNTSISIRFGDLFKSGGHVAIPVNEFFDSKIGDLVSTVTVHGQFIQTILGGNSAKFDEDTSIALAEKPFVEVQRSTGRKRKYEIGTTAVVTEGVRKYLLFALSKTDLITHKAQADIPQLWEALRGLWRAARGSANGGTVSVPLVGGGQSGVGIEPSQLVRLILLSVLAETRAAPITSGGIEVVLHPSLLASVDLDAIVNDWK